VIPKGIDMRYLTAKSFDETSCRCVDSKKTWHKKHTLKLWIYWLDQ